MKTRSLSLGVEKRLPEKANAIAMMPEMAKVSAYTNTAFAETLQKAISHINLNQ